MFNYAVMQFIPTQVCFKMFVLINVHGFVHQHSNFEHHSVRLD